MRVKPGRSHIFVANNVVSDRTVMICVFKSWKPPYSSNGYSYSSLAQIPGLTLDAFPLMRELVASIAGFSSRLAWR